MKTYNLSKKKLIEVPFHLVHENADYVKELAIHCYWLLPQALAGLAAEVRPVRVNNLYNANETIKANMNLFSQGPDWSKGFYKYLRASPRGSIITGKASSPAMLPYSALVPLYLAAFKKFSNIKYSEWDRDSLASIIDPGLHDAMMTTVPERDSEQLLELRVIGSTIKSGTKGGQVKNPLAVTALTTTGDAEFDALPRLAKIMLCQVWLAHPGLRNEYMILNPASWDNMPVPLITADITTTKTIIEPWD